MPFEIIRSDITALPVRVDAIVDTANPRPAIGSGTDRAIHAAAGPELLAARKAIGSLERGQSAITPAFRLNARYVIHSVGPRWQGGGFGEEEILRSAYDTALALAAANGCRSVAFPLMAAGSYGFPKEKALSVANQAIGDFLLRQNMDVYLVVYNTEAFRLSRSLQRDIRAFIDDYYVDAAAKDETESDLLCSGVGLALRDEDAGERSGKRRRFRGDVCNAVSAPPPGRAPQPKKRFSELFTECADLEALLERRRETFSQALTRIIDERGWKDSEVYKRAGMDKKLFNKIVNAKDYHPTKTNALLLAVALQLNLDETRDFIAKAGYVLTETSDFDLIVAYFISKKQYDYITINEVLFARGLGLLSKGY